MHTPSILKQFMPLQESKIGIYMSWRYGLSIIKLLDGSDYYEVREFHQGVVAGKKHGYTSWTENPAAAGGNTRKEAIEDLEMMLADCKKFKAKRIPPPHTNSKVKAVKT